MAGLPKSIIKKHGITKKAWAVYRGSKKRKASKKTYPSRRKIAHVTSRKRRSSKGATRPARKKGASMLPILAGIAAAIFLTKKK